MAKTYKVSTVEVSAQSRKEWLARKRGKGEVATSAAAVVVQSEASSAPSALDALFRQVNIGTDDAPKYVAEALFPLRIGDALLDWHADQKYLGVEHATETEKANFFATGGVTAGGIGSSSGGSGEGGSSTLAGLNDVALKSAIAKDMLVYNGTHWVNTPMSAIKPDLTAYATKTWVEDKGYALNTALLEVDDRLANVETIFEADSDGAINKWSEVVAFLDGIEGDTLDSILAQFATMQWVEDKKYITADALAPYALKTSIPTKNSELENDAEYITSAALNGYATQSWVKDQKYLDGIDSTMVIDALGYTPYNAAYFTKANIKSTLGISDWALEGDKPTYQYSEIQGIPDLSVYFLKTSFTKDNIKTTLGISDWALAASKPSYKWSEINERPVKLSQFTDDVVKDNYLPIYGTAKNAEKLGNQAPAYYATTAALSTLSTAVTEFRTLFDSLFEKDTANNAIKAKLSLYSVGGITAGGIGSGSSSGGGGASYNRLDAWADYTNDKSGWVLSALLGKDLDTRVNVLANAGYITSAALDPYAKSADVADTYATKTALQGVDIRVQAIEYIFEKDNDGVINKWSEIVDFLAGVEGTTLDSILDQFATKDSLAGYLPLSGGSVGGIFKLTGSEFWIQRPSGTSIIFANKNGEEKYWFGYKEDGRLFATDNGYNNTYYVLHSGNYSGYTYTKAQVDAKFTGKSVYVARTQIVNNTDADSLLQNGASLNATGNGSGNTNFPTKYSIFTTFAQSDNYTAQLSIGTELHYRRKIDSWRDWATVLDSNNYTGYTVPKTGGTFSGNVTAPTFIGDLQGLAEVATVSRGLARKTREITTQEEFDSFLFGDRLAFTQFRGGSSYGGWDTSGVRGGDGMLISVPWANTNLGAQLVFDDERPYMALRAKNVTWSDWEQIAFISSNVASATKLQTPRTLWGKSFNGTGDVDGTLTISGSFIETMVKTKSPNYELGFGVGEGNINRGIYDFTNSSWWIYRDARVNTYIPQGNVGIGTTNPAEKLDVAGNIKTSGSVRIGDAILSWDAVNKCITIKNANTSEKASLFVDGGVTGTKIN